MKLTLTALLLAPLASLVFGLTGLAEGQVVLYPTPSGLTASTQFQVQVLTNGVWTDSYVNFNRARTSGSGSGDEPGKTFSWTTFETAGPVAVRVKRVEGGFDRCLIRPTRFGITATNVGDNMVEFTLQPGQKVSVEFDTDIKPWCYTGPPYGMACVKNLLMIFADPLKRVSAINGIPASDIYTVTPGTHQTNVTVTGASPPVAGRSTLGDCDSKQVAVLGAVLHQRRRRAHPGHAGQFQDGRRLDLQQRRPAQSIRCN
jgi:hypothetical protein